MKNAGKQTVLVTFYLYCMDKIFWGVLHKKESRAGLGCFEGEIKEFSFLGKLSF